MTSKIIELKEIYDPNPKDDNVAGQQVQNGVFTNRFDEKIVLDKGDQIKIKSVFINDSVGEQGLIIVPKDVPVKITVGYYIKDWGSYNFQSTYENGRTYVKHNLAPIAPGGDSTPRSNFHYVFCRPIAHAGTYLSVTAIRIKWRHDAVFKADWLGFNAHLSFTYLNPDGVGKLITFSITKRVVQELMQYDSLAKCHYIELSKDNVHRLKSGTIPFPLIASNNPTFEEQSSVPEGSENIYDFSSTTITAGTQSFVTHTKDVTFTIKKNENGYSPAELAQVVTDNMTKLAPNENHIVAESNESNLITTTLVEETAAAGGIYLEEFGNRLFTTNVAANVTRDQWVGTNQFAIVYRDDLGGKFEIQSTHLPLFSGGQEGVLLLNNGVSNYVANKHSGVFITKTEPPDFFSKYFRINDADIMSCEGSAFNNKTMSGYPLGTSFPTYNFEEGKNVTGQMVGLDTIIDKENFSFEKPQAYRPMTNQINLGAGLVPNFETQANGENAGVSSSFIAETQHTTILGDDIQFTSLSDAYYQIEIDLPIRSDINSSLKTNKKIHGLVGRFYNTNGYTQAVEGEGSFSYIHTSNEPLYISEMNVRILNSKGEVADNIKEDNTVFLEIIKQNPNQI